MITKDNSAIEQKKIRLISLITQLYDIDIDIIDKIENILTSGQKDWWNLISETEKQAIDIGLNDVKQNLLISNEQVIKDFNERYKEL